MYKNIINQLNSIYIVLEQTAVKRHVTTVIEIDQSDKWSFRHRQHASRSAVSCLCAVKKYVKKWKNGKNISAHSIVWELQNLTGYKKEYTLLPHARPCINLWWYVLYISCLSFSSQSIVVFDRLCLMVYSKFSLIDLILLSSILLQLQIDHQNR